MPIEAVIFDLGRVLVDIDFTRGLLRLLAASGAESAEEYVARLSRDRLFTDYCAGKLTPEEFHREFCRKTGLSLSFDEFARRWCDIFAPMPGMEELLAEVARSYRVGILSDTDPLHWEFLRREYPFLQQVEKPTLSFETGFVKPAPEAFLLATERVGAKPEECFFTDDKSENVQAAQAVGMTARTFTSAADLRETLRRLRQRPAR
jgi:HAD superfamily hydrolase (TIGR01509 family)